MPDTTPLSSASIASMRRTKIITAIGASLQDEEAAQRLVGSGIDDICLRLDEATAEVHRQQISWLREAARAARRPISIIQDLGGPQLQIGDVSGIVTVQKGQALSFVAHNAPQTGSHIPTLFDLSQYVRRGERVLVADGRVRTVVSSVHDGVVHVRAESDGVIVRQQSLHLPDTNLANAMLPESDRRQLHLGSALDVDYVAMSLVQTADDVRALKTMLHSLGSTAKVIAKIQTQAAVENVIQIMQESDAVMIMRSELSAELPSEQVPIVQRSLIGLGQQHATPTIVWTHPVMPQISSTELVQIEIADVATAVLAGADSVMLAGIDDARLIETIKAMKRTIRYTESHVPFQPAWTTVSKPTRQAAISEAVVELAKRIHVTAIVADTPSGATALQLAALRANVPLLAVTPDARTAQQLAIVFAVTSYARPHDPHAAYKLTDWLRHHDVLQRGEVIIAVSGEHPGVVGATDTIKVRVLE